MSRVFVTGAGGFIGRRVIDRLIVGGHEVHGVFSDANRPRDARVNWHCGDLLTPGTANNLADEAGATHLLHLAWYTCPGRFWSAAENIDWITATLRLLRAFAAAGGRRVVVAGTCAEYAWGDDILNEVQTPLVPASLYGACKHATHVAGAAFCKQLEVSLAWGRIFFLYRPDEDPERLVASVARGLLLGERVATTEGRQLRLPPR